MPEVIAFRTIPAKILLPIDFSPSSHIALERATELAQYFHADLLLAHVIQEGVNSEEAQKEAKAMLDKSVAGLSAKGIKAKAIVEVDEDIASRLIDVAEDEKIDLIVISSHGTTGWHPIVFGSIAEKILRLAHIPVLLNRTEKPESSVKLKLGRLMEWW
jgi:nucleotide-binding universal stress UspA family protein